MARIIEKGNVGTNELITKILHRSVEPGFIKIDLSNTAGQT